MQDLDLFIPSVLCEEFDSYDITDFSVVVYAGRIYLEWNDLKDGYTENKLITTQQRVRDMIASGLNREAYFIDMYYALNRSFAFKCDHYGKTVDGESYVEALRKLYSILVK